MKRAISACLCLLITAKCFAQSGSSEDSSSAGPEATFEAMKSAALKKNWKGFAAVLTPRSLDMMIGSLSMMSMMPGAEAAKTKELQSLLEKHGAKPLDPQALVSTGGDQKKVMAAITKIGEGVKDKVGCVGEAMDWVEKNMKDNPFTKGFDPEEVNASKLLDVKIDGDSATAKATTKAGKTDDISFKKIDGRWLVDIAATLDK